MKKSITLKSIALQALLILLAIWPALYNQFPLVTPDSAAYIHSGIRWPSGIDRPFGYSFFIFFTSWKISLWGPILAQGAIFSWLVQRLIKKLSGTATDQLTITVITLIIVSGTAAAWFNSQLMADAFSGLLVIVILLLFLGTNNKRENLFLLLLLYCFQLTHTSHIITSLLFCTITFVFFRIKKQKEFTKICRNIFLVSVAGYLTISLSYAVGGYGFRLSPISHMFLMSRMAENGILDQYLEEHCPTDHFSLCDFQGKTGNRQWDFMWSDNFPHSKENGWINTRQEYNKIIYGSLSSPKYLKMHIVKNAEAGLRQLAQLYVGDGINQQNPPGSSPYNIIGEDFKHELKEFSMSCQNCRSTGKLPFEEINFIIMLFTVLAGAISLYIGRTYKINTAQNKINWELIFGITMLFIVLNAFITATFSTVIARLQVRVFWVLPALCTIYIFDYLGNKKRLID